METCIESHPDNLLNSMQTKNPFLICACCGEPVIGYSGRYYNEKVFCSTHCENEWKYKEFEIQEIPDYYKNIVCINCLDVIKSTDFVRVKTAAFCSDKCLKEWENKKLLKKCKSGKISFLDLPKELREIGRTRDKTPLKCHARECGICGTIFYANHKFESNRKYCSDRCTKIAIKRNAEKNWWRTTGWMSPNWKGGINNGIYCHKFNADLRRRVREFFGNKCFLCGKPQEENPKRLAVHHVNYNKNACCDSSRVMLVPLCLECHGKTNHERERWEDYIETILREQYNYKCYYTKEEYIEMKSHECSS